MVTWKAWARAVAPSFSSRFLPAMNTFRLRGAPAALDCLWHSVSAAARIWWNSHREYNQHASLQTYITCKLTKKCVCFCVCLTLFGYVGHCITNRSQFKCTASIQMIPWKWTFFFEVWSEVHFFAFNGCHVCYVAECQMSNCWFADNKTTVLIQKDKSACV